MSLLKKTAQKLTAYPKLKRAAKNCYAYAGNFLSDKKTDLAGLVQISSDSTEHCFGYYDKSPWNRDGSCMIYLTAENAAGRYVSDGVTSVVLYDTVLKKERIAAQTHVWNSQQGSMLQWLGPDYASHILFNDFRDGRYCSVKHSAADGGETVLALPVYSVSSDGKTALSLDFSRLNTFRPGYGYCNTDDITSDEKYPDTACIQKLNIEDNTVCELPVTYKYLAQFMPHDGMSDSFHKINHIMLNPSATRFMFIHRWILNGVTRHRLMTCDTDGRNIYVLFDEGFVSHCSWKDDETIISYCCSEEYSECYHILHDKSQKRETIGRGILTSDGHPTFSPDGRFIITDTYPDFKRKQALYLIRVSDGRVKKLGSVYSNIKYRNETRCDLHPRWNHSSDEICIDASPGQKRQVYKAAADKDFN